MYDNEFFTGVIENFRALEEVDCVALGGSRATGESGADSDFDIYVYCSKELTYEQRKAASAAFVREAEISNSYWEPEDNCVLSDGTGLDIIYREVKNMERYLGYVVDGGNAFTGYTTCIWHNIITSEVLFDKSGSFTALKERYSIPYPEELRESIIAKNRNLLSGKLPSYDKQIKKAKDRGDFVSVHHRTTEFLASYFDIIFALNRMTHPGEKRLIKLCLRHCAVLPADFEKNLTELLSEVPYGDPCPAVARIVAELDKVL